MGQRDIARDFRRDLERSLSARDEDFWHVAYKAAFPDLVECHMVTDVRQQKLGKDRQLHLEGGQVFRVQEKVRDRDYGDIALELFHRTDIRKAEAERLWRENRNEPWTSCRAGENGWNGWFVEPAHFDYLAYAFRASRVVYLLPWELLRRAWRAHRLEWIAAGALIASPNRRYVSLSLGVSIPAIMTAVRDAIRVEVDRPCPVVPPALRRRAEQSTLELPE
jgi:hypothetical protein